MCVWKHERTCAERWREARTLYRRALRTDPERFDAALGLGMAYLHTGQAGDAISYLKVAYRKLPWAAQVNFFLGEAYRIVGDRRAWSHLTNAEQWATLPAWQERAAIALAELRASEDL
jgi:predicted Zn-dependent protease